MIKEVELNKGGRTLICFTEYLYMNARNTKTKEDIIVGEFKMTGGNTINVDNVDLVTKRWNHLWWLSEWKRDNSWRLIKYVRKDSPMTACKLTINPEQAQELINKLNLVSENVGFASGFSWRREEDMKHLAEWRAKRYAHK